MKPMQAKTGRGFTLIELLLAVILIAILSAMALPLYTQYLQRGRRTDALRALSAMAQAQERYRGQAAAYADALDKLDMAPSSTHYDYALFPGEAGTYQAGYTLSASPKAGSPQQQDTVCARLMLTLHLGQLQGRSEDGAKNDSSARCWPQ